MLEGIGKIGSYLKQQDLKLQANYKIKNGQSLKDQLRDLEKAENDWSAQYGVSSTKKKKTNNAQKMRVSLIKQKLRRGKELTSDEMRVLKETDESLYSKAKKAQQTRAELQRALRQARTKEEAQRAVMQAQVKVAAEAQMESKSGSVDMGAMAAGAADMGTASAASFSSDVAGDIGSLEADAGAQATGGPVSVETSGGEIGESAAAQAEKTPTGEAQLAAQALSSDAELENMAEEAIASENLPSEDGEDDSATAKVDAYIEAETEAAELDMPMEKFLFMLVAIQDEWNKFAHSKNYEELPDNYIDTEEKPNSTKAPYRPMGMKNIAATEGYQGAPIAQEIGNFLDTKSEQPTTI